jgi:3'(2'), 5'-bisphosphate nucleotidase
MQIDKKLLNAIIKITHTAGEIILQYFHQADMTVNHKPDASPVTAADVEANHYIWDALQRLIPLPCISEDSQQAFIEPADFFWLIDPLDGTKEFIKRSDEFTVNIALIHQQRPVLGVIYAPRSNVTYAAASNLGAYKISDNTWTQLPLNQSNDNPLMLVTSRSHPDSNTESYIKRLAAKLQIMIKPMGSSLKFCMLAEGSANLYPRLSPIMNWDIAAGDCIVNESQGALIDVNTGKPVLYAMGAQKIEAFIACDRNAKKFVNTTL